ncbi:SPASM domain-containing protein [Bacteroides thetaiotaomicron]|nr:SPASM domain-containing protein [Bacteroides thetaiotaomicron]
MEPCLQTNGASSSRENNWLVGVSIDGPQEFHDEYRKNKMGKPSFVKVMQGINLLKKHGVEWNAMAVVNDFNAEYPLDFYNFFKEIDCHYIQFAPIVERIVSHQDGRHLASLAEGKEGALADFSVSPEQWGNFLCTIFDEWVKEDVGKFFIQIFDSTLANWMGEQPGVCTMAKHCGHAGVMEFNGDVYSCDHFVFPEYKLGNIYSQTLVEMMHSERQHNFGTMKYQSLPNPMQGVRLSICLQRRMSKEPLQSDSGRRTRSELSVQRILPILSACSSLYGFHEKRINESTGSCQHHESTKRREV